MLLGGVKRMREQRLEFGVPVLSKTPYINRLFRNIGVGRRTDSLMLMVTPRIIILEEEEDRLGVKTINSGTPDPGLWSGRRSCDFPSRPAAGGLVPPAAFLHFEGNHLRIQRALE